MSRRRIFRQADLFGDPPPEAPPGYPLPGAREAPAFRVYSGCRSKSGACVYVDGKLLRPDASQKVRNHSPDGFNWGYGGSGPAQLALAILLAEGLSADVAQHHYQDFKFAFVGKWKADTWTLSSTEIQSWLATRPAPPPAEDLDGPDQRG